MWQIPDLIRRATVRPLAVSFVNTAAESPYSLSLASRIASSSSLATIKATTQIDGWYNKLLYLTSGLDENSNLANHDFDLLIRHDGRSWAIIVSQSLFKGYRSNFTITAEPYDPNTYMDYSEMLRAAAASCPIPQ